MFIKNKVKIMGREYKLIERDTFEPGSSGEMGAACIATGEILIRKDMDEGAKNETLVHEIIELIIKNNELAYDHKDITVLGNCIYGVFKDNGVIR